MELTKNKSAELMDRRKAIVANGVGVFVNSTADHASNGTITTMDGVELIDFGGGIGVLNAGHCPPPVVDAIKQQAEKLIHSCFHVSTYEPYLELCEMLASLFPHGDTTKVMLTNTGAEAVENAIKIARQSTGREAIIAFTEAFHGRSMMAMSLTSKIDYKKGCGPFAPEVYRIPFPNYYHRGNGMTEIEFSNQELEYLNEAFKNLVDPKNVAAIIIELVQGEGGFNVAPKPYVQGLRKICDDHGILLIVDEVQSGFCRTGEWASYFHYDITPDISTWAKSMGSGMPIGAVVGKQKVMDGAAPGTIGGTYLGNPVSCAAAIATIKYMDEIDLNSKAEQVAKTVSESMTRMRKKYSSIGDVRGLGAMQAMEFVKNGDPNQPDGETATRLMEACLKRGLLILNAGIHKNVIRILSPLTIPEEQLKMGLQIMEEELEKISKGK